MKIVCIDNKGIENQLTLNKKYDIIPDNVDSLYHISKNDLGYLDWYGKSRFISLENYREGQLNSLLT